MITPEAASPTPSRRPLPLVVEHPEEMTGRWWLYASTPDGTSRVGVGAGGAHFSVTPSRRLMFDFELTQRDGRVRRVHGVASARATPAGLFTWRGRGFARFVTWFRWGYRLTADGSLLVISHPGSIATHRNVFVLARHDIDSDRAADLLAENARAVDLAPEELRDLARYAR